MQEKFRIRIYNTEIYLPLGGKIEYKGFIYLTSKKCDTGGKSLVSTGSVKRWKNKWKIHNTWLYANSCRYIVYKISYYVMFMSY